MRGRRQGVCRRSRCTLTELTASLVDHVDNDPAPPAISTGVYFGLGASRVGSTTAVDKFVFNTYTFDFEPNGVFLHTS